MKIILYYYNLKNCKMIFEFNNRLGKFLLLFIQKYNHKKYWDRRSKVVDPSFKNPLLKLYYLYYIKKKDDYYNCSFGTNYNSGSKFETPPNLPHGPKNIIIGHDITFGRNVTIFQCVTVAHGGGEIGDNVLLSAGSIILSGKNIGENSKIGANAVVVEDIPANSTVVLNKPRILTNKY